MQSYFINYYAAMYVVVVFVYRPPRQEHCIINMKYSTNNRNLGYLISLNIVIGFEKSDKNIVS